MDTFCFMWLRVTTIILGLTSLVGSSLAAEPAINACKYLIVQDFQSDPFGVALELRAQGRAKGLMVVSTMNEVPAPDALRACVMFGSWSANGFGGQLAMRVVDASGALVAEASSKATAWINASHTVHAGVAKIYSELGFTGFDEDLHKLRIESEFPARPTLSVTEDTIKKTEPKDHIQGIWTDAQDQYRLGIVTAPQASGADYVAVILRSNSPLWKPGEIKAEIRNTASPDVFTCTYFMRDKKPAGITLTVEQASLIRGSPINTSAGAFSLMLVRVWPKLGSEEASDKAGATLSFGTGFLLNLTGLIATNWHVVADSKSITAEFPNSSSPAKAQVVIRDRVNDLAILRLDNSGQLQSACPQLPFRLKSANEIALGTPVSTIGYPLATMLGSSPKFAGCRCQPRYSQDRVAVRFSTRTGILLASSLRVWTTPRHSRP